MRFYTVQKLGPKRSLTPEGFLLCEEVPVARTGEMLYGDGEVPIEPGPDGLIRIGRSPEEVFRAETIASCLGKPVTLDHPDDFVTPETYQALSRGNMLNIRRGAGIEDDLMVADLLVTDKDAIKAVQDDGIEEVSLGYEADYEQISPGRGVQRNIVVNHVALVARGRCGPRCAIGDKEPEDMKTFDSKPKGKRTWLDRVRTAFKAGDAEALEEALEEGTMDEETEEERKAREAKEESGKTGDALSKIMAKLKSMDADIQELKKANETDDEETEEEKAAREAKDAILEAETAAKNPDAAGETYTGDSMTDTVARAEILAPGVKLPTFDSKTKTTDAICRCQRKALDVAYQTDAGRKAIEPFLNGKTADFAGMPPSQVKAAFTGAAEIMRAQNNAAGARGNATTKDFGRRTMVADMNRTNAEFWKGRTAK